MVEANDEDGFGEDGGDWGEDGDGDEGWGDDAWDNPYGEEEEDPVEQARRIQEELKREAEQEAAVEQNMKLIEDMRNARLALMDNPVQRLTNWKLISVKGFIALCKKELSEEQKVPVDEVDWSKLQEQVCSICYCELYENIKDMPEHEIEQLENDQKAFLKSIDVVQMSECKGHFFHAECL